MRFFWFFALALAVLTNTGAAPLNRNYIAAIVNDTVITVEAVRASTDKTMQVLFDTYKDRPDLLQEKQLAVFDEALQNLIDRELILQDFISSGGKFPESVIDEEIQDRIRTTFGDRARLTQTLQAQGITSEAYRKQLRDDIVVGWMSREHIHSAILVSPAKIERYYQDNLEKFKVGDEVKVRMIVMGRASGVSPEEIKRLALEVKSKVELGASFAEMAGIYSEGSQRTRNGDWGWVQREELNLGLADVAFNLTPGTTGPVLGMARSGGIYWVYQYDENGKLLIGRKYTDKDKFVEEQSFESLNELPPPVPPGEYYLVHVEARRSARTQPLTEVREQIEKELTAQERERLRRRWIDRLREKAFVRYF